VRADARITNALKDEDNMASDSATHVPSQQSVKAFVDGSVSTLNSAITTANTEMKAYVDAKDIDDDLTFTGDDGTGRTLDLDAATLTLAGGTGLTSASTASAVTFNLDNTAVSAGSYGSATAVATFTVDAQGRLTAAGEASITTSLTIQSDDASDNVVALATDKLKLLGGTNITSTNTADDVTFNLNSTLNSLTAVNTGAMTATGIVSFGTLTDSGETIAVTKFVDEGDGISNNDNDTTLPTSAAVKVTFVQADGSTPAVITGGVVTGVVEYKYTQ
jgi:hypothetical protein